MQWIDTLKGPYWGETRWTEEMKEGVAHIRNPRTWQAEARELPQVPGQTRLYSKTLSENINKLDCRGSIVDQKN